MVIGIDASRANRQQKTGVEWYSYYLIEELKKIDFENHYILYSDTPLQGDLAKLPSNWESQVLKWPFKAFWTLGRLSLEMFIEKIKDLRFKIQDLRRNVDLSRVVGRPSSREILSSSRPSTPFQAVTPQDDSKRLDVLFVPAHGIPLIHPKKTIAVCHDLAFERFPEVYSQEAIGYKNPFWKFFSNLGVKIWTLGFFKNTKLDYLRWSTKFALKHAEKIIVPSEFTKRELIDLYDADVGKIAVIYHGYDEKTYQVIDDLDLRFKNKDLRIRNQKFILYIGRLEKKKNVLGLIKAFKIFQTYKLPRPRSAKRGGQAISYKLILIGQPGYGYEEIKKEIEGQKDILELGWIDQKDLVYFLNKASLFVLPSFYEGFGLPVIEAMACGTPVIVSQVGSLPEIAVDAALLVDPKKLEEIAQAMKRVLEDEGLRKKLRAKGLERAKDFSWEKCAKKTLNQLC